MSQFYIPDLDSKRDSLFACDADNKLVRRSFWLDMSYHSIVMALTQGIGAHLRNEQKRAPPADIRQQNLIDDICVQEICRLRTERFRTNKVLQ